VSEAGGRIRFVLARYRYRIYPDAAQRQALARVFGCARVVFNDSIRLREETRQRGGKISDTEVQRQVITLAKTTPEREWLGEVACGVKDGPKPLSVREWTCKACGTVHDRDVNAARNVLALGQRERVNASGGGVRPGPGPAAAGERGTRRSAA
jgi:transposase